jgi:aryl-alcohol dehydrogenase-like predicted oxidoreductase
VRYRTLGSTGLEVSEVSLGTWAFGGDEWGPSDDDGALETMRSAIDLGVNLLDTADVYGYGHSEELIGRLMRDMRDRVRLCSKAGNDIYDTPQTAGGGPKSFSPEYLRRAVQGSVRRLGVDTIDVYLLHNPSLEVIEDGAALGELAERAQAGDIRFPGASIYTAQEGRAAIAAGARVLEITYNLIAQDEGRALLPYAAEHGVGVLARSPLANGLLTGKYTAQSEFAEDDHRSHKGEAWLQGGLRKLDDLRFLTADGSRSLAQAALGFVLASPAVTSVVVGARSPEQFAENARACDVRLGAEELERIELLNAGW